MTTEPSAPISLTSLRQLHAVAKANIAGIGKQAEQLRTTHATWLRVQAELEAAIAACEEPAKLKAVEEAAGG